MFSFWSENKTYLYFVYLRACREEVYFNKKVEFDPQIAGIRVFSIPPVLGNQFTTWVNDSSTLSTVSLCVGQQGAKQ